MRLTATIDVPVPADVAFRYFADSRRMFDVPDGVPVEMDGEPRAGARFRVQRRRDVVLGEIVAYERGRVLTIRSWNEKRPDCITTHTLEFHPMKGHTRLASTIDMPLPALSSAIMWLFLPVYRLHVRRTGRRMADVMERQYREDPAASN